MISKKKLRILRILLVLGMLVSVYLVFEHFSTVLSEFCKFGESFDCGIVNKSPYANVDGISYLLTIDFGWQVPLIDISGINFLFDLLTSNAFLGFLTLLFLLMLVNAYKNGRKFLWIGKPEVLAWMKGITLFSVLYGFYLFLVQHFLLKTYCIFCLALDIILIILFVIIWGIKK